MKMKASKYVRAAKIAAAGAPVFLAIGPTFYLGTLNAQQSAPTSDQINALPKRADGMPMNFPFREPDPMDFNDHKGYVQIFNGTNLQGWDGDPSIWHVEDGAIVGEHEKGKTLNNTYIVYRGFEAKDFDLKLEIKVEEGGGTGIQYRSKTGVPWIRPLRPGAPPPNMNWMMTGPQADFWFPVPPFYSVFSGQFYSENTPLGIVAWRGQVVQMMPEVPRS